jgi:hypothetical protein
MAEVECEECKGGDCEIHPQFESPASGANSDDKKVRLTTSKYVQLLIDARETNPDCWPPGLEKAAAMIERARTIEDNCVEKWGEFDPAKLSKKQQSEYFEIQLALDALQDEAGSDEVALEDAIRSAHQAVAESATATTPASSTSTSTPAERGTPAPTSSGSPLPTPVAPPIEGGFFARRRFRRTISSSRPWPQALRPSSTPKLKKLSLCWSPTAGSEMPPLQRGDNYA